METALEQLAEELESPPTPISYEGGNAEELCKDSHDGVDDYLAMCKEKISRQSSTSPIFILPAQKRMLTN